MNPSFLITIDVEDWFQVENFKKCISFSSWPHRELRVEQNTHNLLDLMDLVPFQPLPNSQSLPTNDEQPAPVTFDMHPKATFFVLGWLAERLPNLIREIYSRGHEIASHGYNHRLCTECTREELTEDLTRSKKLLEDIIGAEIKGYRAPSFSVNEDILKLIGDCGYLYDSSYNSFSMHGRYGKMSLSSNGSKRIAIEIPKEGSNQIVYELPISNINVWKWTLPWGGGAYFRLISRPVFSMGIDLLLKRKGAYLFYMHPWEIDPDQPRVKAVPAFLKFRHYVNLKKTAGKLKNMLENFVNCNFTTCSRYLEDLE